MPGLSISALARQAGVSQQGVSAAVKRGVLWRGSDGLIDPTVEPNKSWLGLHAMGLDWRGRDMWTYARPTGTKVPESVPAEVGDTAERDRPDETAFSDAELDAFLKKALAEAPRSPLFTDAELDELLAGDIKDLLDEPPALTALGELLQRWGNVEIDPDFADRLRGELATDAGRTILAAVLAGIPGEFAALRAEIAELRALAESVRDRSPTSAAGARSD